MIHVLNPFQLSTSMLRFAAYSWETQLRVFKLATDISTCSNPLMISREAILRKEPTDVVEPTKPTRAKPAAKRVSKPVAKRVAKPATTTASKPKPAGSPVKAAIAEKAEPATSEPKKYRAPSSPPAMPAVKPEA